MLAAPSPNALKIVRFFLDNPHSIDTPRGVSAWTNIPISETRRILEELTRRGVLAAYRTSSTVGYSLTDSKKVLKSVRELLKKAS